MTTSQVNAIDTNTTQTKAQKAAKMVHRIVSRMTNEEKLKLVKDLLPKDFLQGTN
jgi:ribosomal protein L31E